jgi:hypothetical protein
MRGIGNDAVQVAFLGICARKLSETMGDLLRLNR